MTGAGSSAPEESPDRSFRFRPEQPLRVGPMSALPELAPASRNFLVGVTRVTPSPGQTFGATVASALPLGALCTAEEDALPDRDDAEPGEAIRPSRCDAPGGHAAALDWNLRSPDAEWFLLGQATASRAAGGPPVRTLADGTELARGDAGWGAHAALGRVGGEPWRFELHWEYESPGLEVNALGFQRTQNEQLGRALVRYAKPKGGGPFHSWTVTTGVEGRRTTDGRGLTRGSQVWLSSEFQLRSFQWLGCTAGLDGTSWDVREVSEAGVAFERPAVTWGECWISSDPSRPIFVEGGLGGGRTRAAGPLASVGFGGLGGKIVVRPHPRLETRVDVQVENARWPARYVGDDSAGDRIFAELSAPSASVTLRQQVVLTPRLTLQGYAQLFTAYGQHGRFFAATAARGERIPFSALRTPATPPREDPEIGEPDFREGALNLNVVARWEYRAGSTLFLVYTRAQGERGWEEDGAPPATLRPHALGVGPTTDTVLVKWTHFWNG